MGEGERGRYCLAGRYCLGVGEADERKRLGSGEAAGKGGREVRLGWDPGRKRGEKRWALVDGLGLSQRSLRSRV